MFIFDMFSMTENYTKLLKIIFLNMFNRNHKIEKQKYYKNTSLIVTKFFPFKICNLFSKRHKYSVLDLLKFYFCLKMLSSIDSSFNGL